MRLTTAKYYTPSHKVIHGQGITPDSVVPMTDEEYELIYMKTWPGLETLSAKEQNEVKDAHDIQLDRARDLLKGILIYTHRSARRVKRSPARRRKKWCPTRNWTTLPNDGERMTLLAVETSCDETSVAVVRDGRVLSNLVSSQIKLHAEYGGVVPELAAREHLRNLMPLTRAALEAAGVTSSNLDAIAATQGPRTAERPAGGTQSRASAGVCVAQAVSGHSSP